MVTCGSPSPQGNPVRISRINDDGCRAAESLVVLRILSVKSVDIIYGHLMKYERDTMACFIKASSTHATQFTHESTCAHLQRDTRGCRLLLLVTSSTYDAITKTTGSTTVSVIDPAKNDLRTSSIETGHACQLDDNVYQWTHRLQFCSVNQEQNGKLGNI